MHWRNYILITLLIVPVVTHAAGTFQRDLKRGDRGEDVRALQEILNSDPVTQVTAAGSGSPGNETDFFGPLTESSVRRFQNIHASEILTPIGLTTGTGYVGPLTRAKLNSLSMSSQPQQEPFIEPFNQTTDTVLPDDTVTREDTNTSSEDHMNMDFETMVATPMDFSPLSPAEVEQRNNENLDVVIEELRALNPQLSADDFAEAERVIREQTREFDYTTTLELQERAPRSFDDLLQIAEDQALPEDTMSYMFLRSAISIADSVFGTLFVPEPVYAQAGLPFGGLVLWFTPCPCSGTAMVAIGPPLGGYFDYEWGTQGFLNFNFPVARYALGFYYPGATGMCLFFFPTGTGCFPVFTQGLISFILGTTPF